MLDMPPLSFIYETKLASEHASLKYVSQSNVESVAFTSGIPFHLIKVWYEFLKSQLE